MSSFNRVIMAGNLTRDPELKQVGGQNLCRLGLASNRQYKNRATGAMVQEVCYVDIDVWGQQADSCSKYLQKGRAVLIEGRLKFDSWKDNEGQTRSKHIVVADKVVFLYNQKESLPEEIVSEPKLDQDLEDQLNKIKKSKSTNEGALSVQPSEASEKTEASSKGRILASKVAKKDSYEDSSENIVPEVEFQDEPPFQDDLPF